MSTFISPSELIINSDGSVFHLHLRPEQLADTVILVGDPDRSTLIASHFDRIESSTASREFRSHTGTLNGVRLTVLSTGIGCDNIDIVMTELDALANVDFATRRVKPLPERRSLQIVRLGTSGALQEDIPFGAMIMATVSGGLDGLLNFYADRARVCDRELEEAFVRQTRWEERWATPYFVPNDPELVERFSDVAIRGLTLSAPGFFGPQGRVVRLPLMRADYIETIRRFEHEGLRVTNFEMESSALAGLSRLMGHKAMTVCMVIANRLIKEANTGYKNTIDTLIKTVLDRI